MTVTPQGEDVVLQVFDKDGTEHRLVLTGAQAQKAKAALAELADVAEPAAEHRKDEEEELKKLEEEEQQLDEEQEGREHAHESSTGWPPPKH